VPEAGTIYFSHDQSTDGAASSPPSSTTDGTAVTVKWKFKIGNFVRQSSPAIDENGIIYFGDLNGYLYAFRDKGACTGQWHASHTAGADLLVQQPERGTRPAVAEAGRLGSGLTASPVISADSNTLYIGTMAPWP
jgi:outer membrane protein assembly factor BamB